MGYAVKEIFLTLQGEGFHAGRAAVFLRFTGCNLWSGREADRARGTGGCARWCDTDFVGTDGEGGGRFDDASALAEAVAARWPWGRGGRPFVVCTGGEPLLQLDEALTRALRARGFEVAIETNGTLRPPPGVDWVCVSPKVGGALLLTEGDELKLVHPQAGFDPAQFESMAFTHHFLQPRDGADRDAHTAAVARYCVEHPRWRMSLQTHKLIGIP
ncbi:MAG: 7-carboxy-7-deazaguanine synthase [Polyangiales bacterium]